MRKHVGPGAPEREELSATQGRTGPIREPIVGRTESGRANCSSSHGPTQFLRFESRLKRLRRCSSCALRSEWRPHCRRWGLAGMGLGQLRSGGRKVTNRQGTPRVWPDSRPSQFCCLPSCASVRISLITVALHAGQGRLRFHSHTQPSRSLRAGSSFSLRPAQVSGQQGEQQDQDN
jgi:hypothetical protein